MDCAHISFKGLLTHMAKIVWFLRLNFGGKDIAISSSNFEVIFLHFPLILRLSGILNKCLEHDKFEITSDSKNGLF